MYNTIISTLLLILFTSLCYFLITSFQREFKKDYNEILDMINLKADQKLLLAKFYFFKEKYYYTHYEEVSELKDAIRKKYEVKI